jgi:formamidopyrimidine-DNA glycosylase
MPELPEVETIRRGLLAHIIGLKIDEVEVSNPRSFTGDSEQLGGRTIVNVERRGKLLIFRLDSEEVFTVHLKMTGQLVWQKGEELLSGGHPQKAYLEPLPHKHTHVIFTFSDGSHLYFNDLRKFGRIVLQNAAALDDDTFIADLGPEPLDKSFTVEYLADSLKRKGKRPIKSFLLDQSNIAGLGNIYADESLFRAAILPFRLGQTLTPGEVRNLYEAIRETIELALLYGGSSSRDYVNAEGEQGTFLEIANVYHRTGLRCNRCNEGTIERVKIGGRSSHFCRLCQR